MFRDGDRVRIRRLPRYQWSISHYPGEFVVVNYDDHSAALASDDGRYRVGWFHFDELIPAKEDLSVFTFLGNEPRKMKDMSVRHLVRAIRCVKSGRYENQKHKIVTLERILKEKQDE